MNYEISDSYNIKIKYLTMDFMYKHMYVDALEYQLTLLT